MSQFTLSNSRIQSPVRNPYESMAQQQPGVALHRSPFLDQLQQREHNLQLEIQKLQLAKLKLQKDSEVLEVEKKKIEEKEKELDN